MTTLRTARLDIVCGTLAMAEAELHDLALFAELVNAEVPSIWPPPLNDEGSQRWLIELLKTNPPGWSNWYAVRRAESGKGTLVGNIGFKGGPSDDGTVEVGYSVLEAHQRRGYASEAVSAITAFAFSHPAVTRVTAHTLPELTPSIGVLTKRGFRLLGTGTEGPETILFELTRTMHEQAVRRPSTSP
ncbi:GNAT family N-acetyltransferase [Gemmatimonas sp.]|uniref:GNAT family N-acetyltransferase n=1 Tax=Gemmatimonas sp. TaxID=1962908 RepID=UPI0033410C5E